MLSQITAPLSCLHRCNSISLSRNNGTSIWHGRAHKVFFAYARASSILNKKTIRVWATTGNGEKTEEVRTVYTWDQLIKSGKFYWKLQYTSFSNEFFVVWCTSAAFNTHLLMTEYHLKVTQHIPRTCYTCKRTLKSENKKQRCIRCWRSPTRSAMHGFTSFVTFLANKVKSSCVKERGSRRDIVHVFGTGQPGNVSPNSFWQVR
jgi:hypothetical protein